ncbi:MAG TPA: ATP-binding cassette domain-containing protein [Polyangiaceae bacterium]|jgi:ABC-2 type transport system ATP-binding protein|nr:ATP-binding cassette domain-containing protein [Polyangiaceae bacterium]
MIRVRALRKHYTVHERAPGIAAAVRALFVREKKTVAAVDGIDFDIAPGERVGFLGPNGAGKTTTLKVLSGLLHPTSGEVSVDGFEPKRRQDAFLKRIMLVLGQKQQLLWDLPPSETFELNRAVYDVPRPQYDETLRELTALLELGDLVRKPTRTLSLGERMKCELAAALIHRPNVLFLDEPTIGLDVSMQATVRDFVKRYNERNAATLILTSHYMEDVAYLCPRVIVIDKGRLVHDGSLEDLVTRTRPDKRIVLRFSKPVDAQDLAALVQRGKVVSHDAGHSVLQVHKDAVNAVVGRALSTLPVSDLTVENPPLEEVMSELFARHRGGANGGGANGGGADGGPRDGAGA